MRESVIYQEILQEGVQEGLQPLLQQGLQQGRQAEAAALIVRLLNRRFGGLAPDFEGIIRGLTVEQLEELAEALLDFEEVTDLERWLGRSPG